VDLFKMVAYLTKTRNDHFLYFTLDNYKKYRLLIPILLLFNKTYKKCKIFRKEYKYHKNIVVVGLKYYGRNVKRRTNGFAKSFLEENPDKNCPDCNSKLNDENINADHIIPISKGGNNTKLNLLACCKDCNEERGDADFYRYLYVKQPKYIEIKYPFI
jgi:hypothetical protein